MNVINSYRNVDYKPNTFFGGVGNTITNPEMMAAKMSGINAGYIKSFAIDENNNISFYVNKNWALSDKAFEENKDLTYIISANNKLTNIGYTLSGGNDVNLFNASNCEWALSYNITFIGRQAIQRSGLKKMYYPKCTGLGNNGFGALSNFKAYFPELTQMGTGLTSFTASYASSKAYFNPYLRTSNNGGINAEIQEFITKGGTVVWTDSLVPPSSITDLSVTPSTTTATVTFTPPASTNAIDFYEVWLEEVGSFNPVHRFTPRDQELTASGQTITGLTSGKTYKLRLATCDVFYNGSGMSETPAFSNEIIFTT
ncbi:MAG: fibronectin type III domain-containing protein [Thermoplasmata archaeon]